MTTIYRTCNSDNLEVCSTQGWAIDQTQYEDDIGYLNGVPVVQRKLVFVLRRDDESVLANACADRDEALVKVQEAEAKVWQLETEIAAFRCKLDAVERLRATDVKEINALNVRLAATGKMERDIAKLRTALGDLRMREILDGDEKR